jgi:amino acid transporter
MGADRTQAVAGYDGAGPRGLGYFSKRYGTPIVVNFLTGVIATIVMVLAFRLAGGSSEKYFNAVLSVVLLFTTMSYIVIFPALIRLRYVYPDVPRPYRVPFGLAGAWACVILTTFWSLLASVVGIFPGLGDGMLLNDKALPPGFTRGEFQLVVFIPVIATLALGVLFYALGRPIRQVLAKGHVSRRP